MSLTVQGTPPLPGCSLAAVGVARPNGCMLSPDPRSPYHFVTVSQSFLASRCYFSRLRVHALMLGACVADKTGEGGNPPSCTSRPGGRLVCVRGGRLWCLPLRRLSRYPATARVVAPRMCTEFSYNRVPHICPPCAMAKIRAILLSAHFEHAFLIQHVVFHVLRCPSDAEERPLLRIECQGIRTGTDHGRHHYIHRQGLRADAKGHRTRFRHDIAATIRDELATCCLKELDIEVH